MNDLSYETFFATLSGNRRMEILKYLQAHGTQSVTEIAEGTGIEQSAVSHSINKLLACEFVHIEVSGRHRYYRLNEETILPLLEGIDRHIAKFCSRTCDCCVTRSGAGQKKEVAA